MAERVEGRNTPVFTSWTGSSIRQKIHAEVESSYKSAIHETVVGMRLRCPLGKACHLEGVPASRESQFIQYRYECRSPQDEGCEERTETLADTAEANVDALLNKISLAVGDAVTSTEVSFPT